VIDRVVDLARDVTVRTACIGRILDVYVKCRNHPSCMGYLDKLGRRFAGRATDARVAWSSEAACLSVDPEELFVDGAAQRRAANICRPCPVVAECLADALDNRIEFGVWGGMTVRQRRVLLKQHPEVTSWSEFLAAQRQHRKTG
jgi:WhiB family transcriptional regulator, redox-sensing transcriptional regulator